MQWMKSFLFLCRIVKYYAKDQESNKKTIFAHNKELTLIKVSIMELKSISIAWHLMLQFNTVILTRDMEPQSANIVCLLITFFEI